MDFSAAQQIFTLLLNSRSHLYYATISLTNIRLGSIRVLWCRPCNCSSLREEKIAVAQPEITFLTRSSALATRRFFLFLQTDSSLNTHLLGFKVKQTLPKSSCTTELWFTPRTRDHLAQLDSSLGKATKRGRKEKWIVQWSNQYQQYR